MHRSSLHRLLIAGLCTGLACTGMACTGSTSPDASVDARSTDTSRSDATPDDAGGSDVPSVDGGATMPSPSVQIVFPVASNTTAERLHVRVRVTEVAVTAVTVDGVAATLVGGDYLAEVPLLMGENAIVARVEHGTEPALTATVTVVRVEDDASLTRGETAWSDQRAFGLLAAPDDRAVYFGDDIYDGAVRIDVATGDHAWVACTEATSRCDDLGGTGVDIVQPLDVRFSPDGLYVSDGDQLVGIDFATHGTRTISGRGTGTGPALGRLASTVLDERRGLVVGLDWDTSTLVTIDPATGDRALFSGADRGTGPEIRAAETLAYDGPRDRVLFFQQYVTPLYAVDRATGDRSVVSDADLGTGPELRDPASITVHGDLAYAWDDEARAVFAIDLVTGARRVVSASDVGLGPLPTTCEIAFGGELVFARDETTLYVLDPASGDRVVVSR